MLYTDSSANVSEMRKRKVFTVCLSPIKEFCENITRIDFIKK